MIQPDKVFVANTMIVSEHSVDRLSMPWKVPNESLDYVEGHFPQQPILPAVGIVDATLEFMKHALDRPTLQLKSIDSCKITGIVIPGMALNIIFDLSKGRHRPRVEWRTVDDKILCDLNIEIDD